MSMELKMNLTNGLNGCRFTEFCFKTLIQPCVTEWLIHNYDVNPEGK